MNKITVASVLIISIIIAACSNTAQENTASSSKAPVTVTHIKKGAISDSVTLSATAFYLSENKITAPVSGYIVRNSFQTGDEVANGVPLFMLQTREARALQSVPDSVKRASDLSDLGNISVKAPSRGLLTAVNYGKDDFVQEGNVLATMVSPDNLYLKLFVPYEQRSIIKQSDQFSIELPSGNVITATVRRTLNQTDSVSQSVLWLLKPREPQLIPKGLKLTVQVSTARHTDTQMLPKEAVLANETLDSFWVMQVMHDTLAVRVPITKGLETVQQVEILRPEFSSSDAIIISGQYGLEDSSAVQIQNPGS